MHEDVMDATQDVAGWETWVVSPDETVLEVALTRRAHAVTEEKPPLANAIRQVEEEATARSADALAVLLPDTPLITTEVLTRALHTLGPVVLAPSTDESGTNLLVRRPPSAIGARFGTDSYRKHLEAAALADLPTAVVDTPGLGFALGPPGRTPPAPRAGPPNAASLAPPRPNAPKGAQTPARTALQPRRGPRGQIGANGDAQRPDPGPGLNAARAFLGWRKTQPALVEGAIHFLDAPAQVLAFVRERQGQRLLVAFNLSPEAIAWTPPAGIASLAAPGVDAAELRDGVLVFPPRGAAYAALE